MTGILVHEWIAQDGGFENMLQAMSDAFPDAEIQCLRNESTGRFDTGRGARVVAGPHPVRWHKAVALPLMPLSGRALRYDGYDWALISSHAFAHDAHFRGGCPASGGWSACTRRPATSGRGRSTRGDSPAARLVSHPLRPLDRLRAHEGAEFAANSAFVRWRIQDTGGSMPG